MSSKMRTACTYAIKIDIALMLAAKSLTAVISRTRKRFTDSNFCMIEARDASVQIIAVSVDEHK